jgi:hypothetical protein
MNYCVRITGPGIDHSVLIADLDDFEVLNAIIAKMRRYVANDINCGELLTLSKPQGD